MKKRTIKKIILASTVVAYGYLFAKPQLFHTTQIKRPFISRMLNGILDKNVQVPIIIPHRGGAHLGVQNTLQRFRQAIKENKIFMVETDVQMTKDGIPVIFHDRDLNRLCQGHDNKAISDFDYKDLPKLHSKQIRLHFQTERQYYFVDPKQDDLQIPKFQDLLILLSKDKQKTWLHFEIKTPSIELIKKIDVLLRKYGMEDRVIWGCTPDKWNKDLFKVNPNVPRCCSWASAVKIMFAYIFGLLPFLPIHQDVFEIPFMTRTLVFHKLKYEDSLWTKIQLTFLKIIWFSIKPLLWHLKKRGIPCFVFPVNSNSDYQMAKNKGVTGVYTDYNNEILRVPYQRPSLERI